MRRTVFQKEHEIFREQFKKFLSREVAPYYEQWEQEGMASREVWKKAGESGFLCPWLPEEYGGSSADFIYSVVMIEECGRGGFPGLGINFHNDIIVPYLWHFGNQEQKERWLKRCASGEIITAIAMTEPEAGSDLQGIRTTALKQGDHYIINGQKTFITNGILSNLVIVAVKTDPNAQPAYKGMSLVCVEEGTPGFRKGRHLKKIGLHAQDLAELVFEDCRVPVRNRLGEEGEGFRMLMKQLPRERLVIALGACAGIWRILELTKAYIKERKAFGKTLSQFQNTRFKMAEMYTWAELLQVFLDRLVQEEAAGAKIEAESAMAKYFATESLNRIANECLQFFGGYGYMEEYPIARAFRDARAQPIYAGTNEIMKEIIARKVLT